MRIAVLKIMVCLWCRTVYMLSMKVAGHWRIDPDVDLELLSNPMIEQIREGMKSGGRLFGLIFMSSLMERIKLAERGFASGLI